MGEPAEPEEKGAELFLQLASQDRKRILSLLQEEDLKLNEVAHHLGLTATEALRQLQRLTEAGLLEKMTDGKYRLSSYGKLVLDTSSPLRFISKYREYFQDHDAFLLPAEFRARLGELSGCELIIPTIDTINKVTEMIEGSQKQLDSVIVGTEAIIEIMRHRRQAGVAMRWLMHESFTHKAPAVLHSWKQLPEIRETPTVPGHIVVNEKSAMLTLRQKDGQMSYSSFYGEDPVFRKWAGDLFMHEWQKAKPWHFVNH